jgi:hypothetical protein
MVAMPSSRRIDACRPSHRLMTLLALCLMSVAASGCAVTLIAPYDEQTDVRLTELARKVDAFFDWSAVERPTYGEARAVHASIRGDLRAIRLRAAAQRKNELTLGQLDAIGKIWDQVEARHRAGPLAPSFVEIERGIVAAAFLDAIRAENDKRRLK